MVEGFGRRLSSCHVSSRKKSK